MKDKYPGGLDRKFDKIFRRHCEAKNVLHKLIILF